MNKKNGILYSAGGIGSSLLISVFASFLVFFYVDHMKMPSDWIGIAMLFYGVWNAINDPLFGHISDKTRTKHGRRKPYILWGTVPLVAVFALVWTPPFDLITNVTWRIVYFFMIIAIFDTLYTVVILNWSALFPEMFKTQKERTNISIIRLVFSIIGNILGVALPPILYTAIGWQAMGIIFAAVGLISLALSYIGSKEDPTYSEGESLPLGKALVETFKSRSFVIYVIAAFFLQFTFVLIQGGIPFYCKYVLQIPEGFQVSLVLGTIFISAMVFALMWRRLINQYGSKKIFMIAVGIFTLALIPYWFVGNLFGGILAGVFLGVGLSALMILLEVMISDVIDEDELTTGARREGMYYGINGFVVRLAVAINSLLLGFILKLSGYSADYAVGAQPASAVLGIKSLVTIVPFIACVIVFLVISRYPLYGERLEALKEHMRLKHTAT